MDKYKVFSSYGAFDIEAKLNEHAQDGYLLALVEIVSHSTEAGMATPEYLVVMEHRPVKLRDRIDVPDWKPTPDSGAGDRVLGEGTAEGEPSKGGTGDATS